MTSKFPDTCRTCGEHDFLDRHRCPPKFYVWNEGTHQFGEDGDLVYAHDHTSAAEKWAEDDDCNSGEYSIVSGSPANVVVRKDGELELKFILIEGESVPSYHADEQNPKYCEHAFYGGDNCYNCNMEYAGAGQLTCPICEEPVEVYYVRKYGEDQRRLPFSLETARYKCHNIGCFHGGRAEELANVRDQQTPS